jgi:predicted acyl esterase
MVSYVINKGHSIRLVVTSSFWPYYSANPNTGALLMPPPTTNHTIWPVWPDHVCSPLATCRSEPWLLLSPLVFS